MSKIKKGSVFRYDFEWVENKNRKSRPCVTAFKLPDNQSNKKDVYILFPITTSDHGNEYFVNLPQSEIKKLKLKSNNSHVVFDVVNVVETEINQYPDRIEKNEHGDFLYGQLSDKITKTIQSKFLELNKQKKVKIITHRL